MTYDSAIACLVQVANYWLLCNSFSVLQYLKQNAPVAWFSSYKLDWHFVPRCVWLTVFLRTLSMYNHRYWEEISVKPQGLRIAPPEAPPTGYMFGKGVYFADMFSKSANYCYANSAATSGVLLLCEV